MLYPYLPVHITGYAIDGFFILVIIISLLVIKLCLSKPKFIKYDEKNQIDHDLNNMDHIKNDNQNILNTKCNKDNKININVIDDNKIHRNRGDSLKLDEEEEGKFDFV